MVPARSDFGSRLFRIMSNQIPAEALRIQEKRKIVPLNVKEIGIIEIKQVTVMKAEYRWRSSFTPART